MNMITNKGKNLSLPIQILIGLGLGIVTGLLLSNHSDLVTTYIQPFGTLFLNLLKMCIVPLVFASLVMGACGLGDIKRIGRVGGKSMLFFLFTTAFATALGLLVGTLFQVGNGLDLAASANVDTIEIGEAPSFIQTLLDIVPSNPFAALTEGNMLQIIFFALFLGAAIVVVGKQAETLKNAVQGLEQIMYRILAGIMKFAPYAVFALIASVVAVNGSSVLMPLLLLIVAVYTACILHALLVYSTLVATVGKTSPLRFFKAAMPAILFSFSSASSSATIPFTMKASQQLGVPSHIRSFVIPLGATINMDGTAAFQGICVLFIANAYGMTLSFSQMLTVVLTATLASIGTAGVPGAGTIMLGMVLQSIGLPLEGIALIMGVERILDMCRTSVNITGDCACSVVVASLEKELHTETPVPSSSTSV